MVSTRSSSQALATPRTGRSSSPTIAPPSTLVKTRNARAAAAASPGWSHVPTTLTLVWLSVSVPIVFWDLGYVFLRPHSFPGGAAHWPLWVPYAIQGGLDLQYGRKKWEDGDGWNAAQSFLNLLENFAYLVYLGIWYRHTKSAAAAGAKSGTTVGLTGKTAAVAVLIGFGTAVTTLIKTLLYWLYEAFSNFDNIGHNAPLKLFTLWIIPNGAWIVFPAILVYTFGSDIINGLTRASSAPARGAKSE